MILYLGEGRDCFKDAWIQIRQEKISTFNWTLGAGIFS